MKAKVLSLNTAFHYWGKKEHLKSLTELYLRLRVFIWGNKKLSKERKANQIKELKKQYKEARKNSETNLY